MDHHARLVRRWLVAALLCCCSGAWAYPATPSGGVYRGAYGTIPTCDKATAAEAVQCALAAQHGVSLAQLDNCTASAGPPPSSGSGSCRYVPNGNTLGSTWIYVSTYSCPNGGTLGGTTCTCPAGMVDSGTACEPVCTAGEETPVRYWQQPGPGGFDSDGGISACDNGCASFFTGYTDAGKSLVDGQVQWWGLGSWKKSGAACSSGAPQPSGDPEVPPDTCAPGTLLGTVNGKPYCAPNDPDGQPATENPGTPKTTEEKTKDTTKTDNGDGTTTTTTTETTTTIDNDGRPTTTTKTTTETCDTAGNCETTETTETEGPGAEDGSPEEEDEGSAFCEENPNSLACAELETPTGPDTPTGTRNIANVTPSGGFGAETGTCPALVQTISIGAVDVFGLVCQYMAGIRFAVIGVAWLIAGLIFLGRID